MEDWHQTKQVLFFLFSEHWNLLKDQLQVVHVLFQFQIEWFLNYHEFVQGVQQEGRVEHS